jgi:hypothetical protein
LDRLVNTYILEGMSIGVKKVAGFNFTEKRRKFND